MYKHYCNTNKTQEKEVEGKSTGLKINQRSKWKACLKRKRLLGREQISWFCVRRARRRLRTDSHSWAPKVNFKINAKLVQQG